MRRCCRRLSSQSSSLPFYMSQPSYNKAKALKRKRVSFAQYNSPPKNIRKELKREEKRRKHDYKGGESVVVVTPLYLTHTHSLKYES